jgi:hypothetical protein
MSVRALSWLLAGGAAALAVAFTVRRLRRSATQEAAAAATNDVSSDAELRNAGLIYRPVGATGERYPDWLRALDGKSGVYVIKEVQRDGSAQIVYVGESHSNRLYDTLTRHLQTWRRDKKFWRDQFGGQGHDPGLTYQRDRVLIAVRVLSPERAIAEETRLIQKLRPRDNLLKQPDEGSEQEVVPF